MGKVRGRRVMNRPEERKRTLASYALEWPAMGKMLLLDVEKI